MNFTTLIIIGAVLITIGYICNLIWQFGGFLAFGTFGVMGLLALIGYEIIIYGASGEWQK